MRMTLCPRSSCMLPTKLPSIVDRKWPAWNLLAMFGELTAWEREELENTMAITFIQIILHSKRTFIVFAKYTNEKTLFAFIMGFPTEGSTGETRIFHARHTTMWRRRLWHHTTVHLEQCYLWHHGSGKVYQYMYFEFCFQNRKVVSILTSQGVAMCRQNVNTQKCMWSPWLPLPPTQVKVP